MIAVYYRNGRLILWAIRKKFVVEFRLPLFIWRTSGKKKEVLSMATKVANKKVRALKFGIPIVNYTEEEDLPTGIERAYVKQ